MQRALSENQAAIKRLKALMLAFDFDAHALAAKSGVNVRVVQNLIAIVNGQPANAWAFDQLPERIREVIKERTGKYYHATPDRELIDSFISRAPQVWPSPIPLSDVHDKAIEKAQKLRCVMARALELRNHPEIASARIDAIIQEDYRCEFGFAVTDRTARALLKRTVERDAFCENWQRLEIYLDGNPQRKAAAAPAVAAGAEQFAELHDIMASFKSAVDPSPRDHEAVWIGAIKILEAQTDADFPEKRVRNCIINYLWKCAPWLSVSKNALRVAFKEKYSRWLEKERHEGALRDGRHAKKGIATKPAIPKELIDNLSGCATFKTGKRISQAQRALVANATTLGLSPEVVDLLTPDSKNKSYVNHRVREAVRYEVAALAPYVIGSRALDTARASLDRDYSNIPSGYCYSADDVTLPLYWFIPDGKGWFNLVRGQCIITIDARTLCILGFSLQPDRNYSSPVIHTNFTRVFSDWGVPKLLYLERGIWKNSKLITGGARAQTNHPDYEFMPFSWAETERGFGDLGVKFIHAIRARSKVVERVIGLVQDLMEGEPGYCGRDERRDCPAHTKAQMDDVNFHRVHPSKHFYDFGQWEARLVEIFAQYNATIQQGKILDGMSPIEAQEKLQSVDETKRPLLFDHTCRHLLAHYRVIKEAGRDGITITIGKNKWVYRNKELSAHKFKKLLCWFDPDEPSALAVTDMNMRNPFTVSLSNSVGALDPDAENLATELARVADYESHAKARYQVLKQNFAMKFRRMVPSRATVETGQAIRQQREVIEEARKKNSSRAGKILRRKSELGLPAGAVRNTPEADEGTALMLAAKRRAEQETATD